MTHEERRAMVSKRKDRVNVDPLIDKWCEAENSYEFLLELSIKELIAIKATLYHNGITGEYVDSNTSLKAAAVRVNKILLKAYA